MKQTAQTDRLAPCWVTPQRRGGTLRTLVGERRVGLAWQEGKRGGQERLSTQKKDVFRIGMRVSSCINTCQKDPFWSSQLDLIGLFNCH